MGKLRHTDERPRVFKSFSLGYYISKNSLYLGITFPEYALHTIGQAACSPGIPNVLENYRKTERVKYSNSRLRRFYTGTLDYDVEQNEGQCNSKEYITRLVFHSETHANRYGWSQFNAGQNDFHAELYPDANDQVWLWKHGFALAITGPCPQTVMPSCRPNPIIIHQFFILPEPPYGIKTTEQPSQYLGR